MSVGDRLAPARQVRLDADQRPAAIPRHAEARTHVIHDQQRAGLIRQLPRTARIGAVGLRLIDEHVVAIGAAEVRARSLPAAATAASRLATSL